ncbi:MAG: type II toxin-antitoxin system RelE/ParE family toxin [Beijerinckiaceae bacterium]|nr:type II toxin-antitoxin system RelE/ParE family toxin [Beijerinckiaceae bacterium]
MKAVTYSRDALKTLRRMPANIAANIRAKIEQYAADPASLANNVTSLKGEPGMFRLRVGDWRVLFSESGEVVGVIRVAARGSVYE